MEVVVFLLVVLVCVPRILAREQCPRDRSRVVSRVVEEDLLLLYEEASAPLPRECPFNPQRSMYGLHEDHKLEENPSRWTCNYCGKSFVEERFLDQHFENRHAEFIRTGSDSVCIADHCDIFRCDIELGFVRAKYWDRLLCRESQLEKLRATCNETFAQCVPKFLVGEERTLFLERLQNAVCGFLTCARYWDDRHETIHPITTAFYVFAAMFVTVVVVIYYYVTCTHFFTDDSVLDQFNDEDKYNPHYQYAGNELRRRTHRYSR